MHDEVVGLMTKDMQKRKLYEVGLVLGKGEGTFMISYNYILSSLFDFKASHYHIFRLFELFG